MAGPYSEKHNRKGVATTIAASGADFKSSIAIRRKELLKLVGTLGTSYAVAQQYHPVSQVTALPCKQESVSRRQCENVSDVASGGRLFLGFRPSRNRYHQKE